MVVRIEVTQEHIDHGQRSDCGKCPIALAVAEKVAEGIYVKVGGYIILHRIKDRQSETAYFSRSVNNFIGKFDSGGTVHPITFETDIRADFLRGDQ